MKNTTGLKREKKTMNVQKKDGKCIVIGAGELIADRIEYDREKDGLIAADGGLMYCEALNMEPDLIIGDFDSLDASGKAEVIKIENRTPEKVKRLSPEKNDTDMLSALKAGLSLGYRKFLLYGATGGRLEHTLANIQCLLFLKHQNAEGYIMDGTGMTAVLENESVSFEKDRRGYLSIFSLGREAKGVTLKGLKYNLDNASIKNDFPIGISNEFTGEQAYVDVKDGTLLLIVNRMED